eukprot:224541-Pleurochrysis_carterae.AAC.2
MGLGSIKIPVAETIFRCHDGAFDQSKADVVTERIREHSGICVLHITPRTKLNSQPAITELCEAARRLYFPTAGHIHGDSAPTGGEIETLLQLGSRSATAVFYAKDGVVTGSEDGQRQTSTLNNDVAVSKQKTAAGPSYKFTTRPHEHASSAAALPLFLHPPPRPSPISALRFS